MSVIEYGHPNLDWHPMRMLHAPLRRPRRYSRTRLVVLACSLIVVAIATLAVVHGPHPTSFPSASSVLTSAAHEIAPSAATHTAAASHTALPDAPASGACATCGGQQDGALATCALVLFVMVALRMAPRSPVPTIAVVNRPRPVRARWREAPRPQAPSLSTLCIMRT